MKVLETHFDGYHFRSRLEARWAVFFKTLKIAYEYEKEGYDLDGVWYLPDFYLPHLDCFIEVKSKDPELQELDKAYRLKRASGKEVYLLFDSIPRIDEVPLRHGAYRIITSDTLDMWQWWTQCPECFMVGLCTYGLAHLLPCHHIKTLYQSYKTLALQEAYAAARSERFGR